MKKQVHSSNNKNNTSGKISPHNDDHSVILNND